MPMFTRPLPLQQHVWARPGGLGMRAGAARSLGASSNALRGGARHLEQLNRPVEPGHRRDCEAGATASMRSLAEAAIAPALPRALLRCRRAATALEPLRTAVRNRRRPAHRSHPESSAATHRLVANRRAASGFGIGRSGSAADPRADAATVDHSAAPITASTGASHVAIVTSSAKRARTSLRATPGEGAQPSAGRPAAPRCAHPSPRCRGRLFRVLQRDQLSAGVAASSRRRRALPSLVVERLSCTSERLKTAPPSSPVHVSHFKSQQRANGLSSSHLHAELLRLGQLRAASSPATRSRSSSTRCRHLAAAALDLFFCCSPTSSTVCR